VLGMRTPYHIILNSFFHDEWSRCKNSIGLTIAYFVVGAYNEKVPLKSDPPGPIGIC
jgi:hypothetical protein